MADPVTSTTSAPVLPQTSSQPRTNVSSLPATGRQTVSESGNSVPAAAQQQVESVRSNRQSAQQLAQATSDISDYIQTVSRSLQISIDSDLGSTIITVRDRDTEEVIRQIPQEEILEIARFIAAQTADAVADPVKGLLMDSEG